jgi:hypothetical protein
MRQTLKDLPSRYLPYPEGTTISIRPLMFGEVIEFTERYDEPIDYYKYLSSIGVVDGIDFWEITTGDWQYIELSIISISYATPSFTIPGPPCDKCSKSEPVKDGEEPESQTFVASLPMNRKKQLPKEYTAKLIPTDLIFNTIEDEITDSVSVDLESGKSVTLDFFRLKHYLNMLENSLNGKAQEICQITGLDLNKDVTYDDFPYLEKAYDMLLHGLDDKVSLSCPSCGDAKEMEVNWSASTLIPFRPDASSLRNRISIGTASKPVNSGDEKPPVSGDSKLVRSTR